MGSDHVLEPQAQVARRTYCGCADEQLADRAKEKRYRPERARAMRPRPLIVSSVRDVLVAPAKPERVAGGARAASRLLRRRPQPEMHHQILRLRPPLFLLDYNREGPKVCRRHMGRTHPCGSVRRTDPRGLGLDSNHLKSGQPNYLWRQLLLIIGYRGNGEPDAELLDNDPPPLKWSALRYGF